MMQGQKEAIDLYCNESLANFDDHCSAKNAPLASTTSRSTMDVSTSISSKLNMDQTDKNNSNLSDGSLEAPKNHAQCRKKLDYENFDSCISILDDNDYIKLLNSDKIFDDDKLVKNETTGHHYKQDSFTATLLKEFTKSTNSDLGKVESMKRSDTTSWISSNNKAHFRSHNWSQTQGSYHQYEQQVPEITMATDDDMDDDNSNIFIIKDEAALDSDSGSELDWSSLTPPAPSSPSDQRVPETESEFDLSGVKYDRLISNSSPELYSSFAPIGHSSNPWYFNQQSSFQTLDVSQSEDDQVVPVF